MQFTPSQLLLYAVTDRCTMEQIEAALRGGVTMVQLREKNLNTAAFTEEAIRVKALCHRYGVPLILNDNVEAALNSGADGVHVGLEDMPVSEIRKRAGADFIVGATAKTIEQARKAEADGADYLGVGAVFPSPTKKNAVRITGEQLKAICGSVSIPAVAIGGITAENLTELKGCGMAGIAVVSALFSSGNVQEAAETLKKAVLAL